VRTLDPVQKRDREGVQRSFAACSDLAGPLAASPGGSAAPTVRYRRSASRRQLAVFGALATLNAATLLAFIGWLLLPSHVPGADVLAGTGDGWRVTVARCGFVIVICVELIRLVQNLSLWIFMFVAKDPLPMEPEDDLRVALLTTIVPSREPIQLVENTLRAMKEVAYSGVVDVWILDEGDDPTVKEVAGRLGV
jgi:hypothetical protein